MYAYYGSPEINLAGPHWQGDCKGEEVDSPCNIIGSYVLELPEGSKSPEQKFKSVKNFA